MRRGKHIFVLGCALAPGVAHAAVHDTQIWSIASVGTAIAGRLSGTIEGSARLVDGAGRLRVTLIRPSLGYRLTPHLNFVLGVTRVATTGGASGTTHETNVYQQLVWTVGRFAGVTVRSRTYLEERRFDGAHDTGLRLRERVRFERPLWKGGPSGIFSNETMFALNTTDWGARAGFDQVRNFVGLNIPLRKGVTLEAGYMNRYQKRAGPDRDDHIIPVSLAVRF